MKKTGEKLFIVDDYKVKQMSTNAEKLKHGLSAEQGLEEIIKDLKFNDFIVDYSTNYRTGYADYGNQSQFFCPFLIEFEDTSKWALFTTTSMRTDRIKGQLWDAYNLKQINSDIVKAYLIYPSGISDEETSKFVAQNKKYEDREEFSSIDAVVSHQIFYNLVEAYAQKDTSFGQVKDKQGNLFESRIARILSYETNLAKWKTSDRNLEGMYYDIYRIITEKLALNRDNITGMSATSDKKVIGLLPTRGNPKTDVMMTVHTKDNMDLVVTFSCKRSNQKKVTVHQYNADAFADVLDRENAELRRLLNLFQKFGNLRDFGEENEALLTEELKPYLRKLIEWVLSGKGGVCTSKHQIADYIITYDNNDDTVSIHSISEYCNLLLERNVKGNFGTPFQWTFPSKQRGNYIQLKCEIIK